MGRNKLTRLEYNLNSDKIIQEGKEIFENISGKWNELVFKNNNPIVLEIGCGDGDYTTGICAQFPELNAIGVDVKGTRIHVGAKKLEENNLHNGAFLRTRMHELESFFTDNEVQEFWITFPDPRPRDRDEKRRLVHPRYLNIYKKIGVENAVVNLKTDNYDLYCYALQVCKEENHEIICQTDNLYASDILSECLGIQTKYEKKYLAEGIKINYLKFRLN